MNTLYGYLQISSSGVKCYMYVSADGTSWLKGQKYTSRGPAGSSGSGPYFKAIKDPSSFTVNGATRQLGLVDNKAPVYYIGGYNAFDKHQFINAGGRNYVTVFGQELISIDVKAKKFKSREYCYYRNRRDGYPYPTDVESWRSQFDSICTSVVSNGVKNYDYIRTDSLTQATLESGQATIVYEHGELDCFKQITDLGVFPGPHASYFSAAYLNAIENLDLLDVNTIANIGELLDAVRTIIDVFHDPLEAVRNVVKNIKRNPRAAIGGAWLSYRYSYTTTKLDVEAYQNMVSRLKHLTALAGRKIHTTGRHNFDGGSYWADIVLEVDDVLPTSVVSWLETLGVEPTPVNVWDLVPYSFIVDWFFNVSDILDYFDKIGNEFRYAPVSCWFTYMSQYNGQHVFYRVPGRRLEALPNYIEKQASETTIKMRVADTVSLLWR